MDAIVIERVLGLVVGSVIVACTLGALIYLLNNYRKNK